MIHYFDVDIATEYGIEEAIVIQNFAFWISKSAANNTNLHEGRYWTYTTIAGISSLFPEIKKARYIVDELVGNGILLKGNFNKTPMDKTCWYAFTDKGLELISRYNILAQSICQNWQMHLPKLANGFAKIGKCNTNISTIIDNNTDNKEIYDNSSLCSELSYTEKVKINDVDDESPENDFERFWHLYDKKVERTKCERLWAKLKKEDKEKIFERLPAYIQSTPDKQYRKNPSTYLNPNEKRWLDEIIPRNINNNDYGRTIKYEHQEHNSGDERNVERERDYTAFSF